MPRSVCFIYFVVLSDIVEEFGDNTWSKVINCVALESICSPNANFLTTRAIIKTHTSLWLCSYYLWESTDSFKNVKKTINFKHFLVKDPRPHTTLGAIQESLKFVRKIWSIELYWEYVHTQIYSSICSLPNVNNTLQELYNNSK